MTNTINEYLAVKAQINQLHKATEDPETKVKSFMDHKGIDTMLAGDRTVSYKTFETARLDTTALKKDFGKDVLDMYMIKSVSKRFLVK